MSKVKLELSLFLDDPKSRRRRRRFFPPEVLHHSHDSNSGTPEPKLRTESNLFTATRTSPLLSPITASSVAQKPTSKRSELSIHMENARKGVPPAFSEMGRQSKPVMKRFVREFQRLSNSESDQNYGSDKETNERTKLLNNEERSKLSHKEERTKISHKEEAAPDKNTSFKNPNVSKRMDELTALTRDTLARVERLANKNSESPKRNVDLTNRYNSMKFKEVTNEKQKLSQKENRSESPKPYSILKKKSIDEPLVEVMHSPPVNVHTLPVSILKRKINDELKYEGSTASSAHTPPVTFSPSVVEPTTTNRKQGILKKRRSLDESQVLRHRSCSPDVANGKSDSKSILKPQRRSSLEEIIRSKSPDPNIQGILKRRTSRNEEDQDSLNSPQGILKRRSGASSAGSTTSSPHISIATAVILAAAGGAEIVLDSPETVKPILKKKSFSDEHPLEMGSTEGLKPILKKKSSTDTDDSEERPKRPILKLSKNSQDSKDSDDSETTRSISLLRQLYQNSNDSSSECEVKPILKQSGSREDSPRPKLSFSADRELPNDETQDVMLRRSKNVRRPSSVCQDINFSSNVKVEREEDRELKKPRPLSVTELIMNFDQITSSTGAIPKKSSLKRNSDRCRTQPITFNELEAR